jgi:hypothetical protein
MRMCGPRSGLDVAKERILFSLMGIELRLSSPQLVALETELCEIVV